MKIDSKTSIVFAVLLCFMTLVFFGFTAMSIGPEGRMNDGCPFSAMGSALCPLDAASAAFHHLGAYASFLNIVLPSFLAFLLLVFLLTAACWLLLLHSLGSPPAGSAARRFFLAPRTDAVNWRTIRWLSLFENSPSLSRGA